MCIDGRTFSCFDTVLYIHGSSLRKYDITVGGVVLMLRVTCVVYMSWHSSRKCCASCVNCCLLQGRRMNLKKSQITGQSTVCLTSYVDPHQGKINVRIADTLWREFTGDHWNPRMKSSDAEKASISWRHRVACLDILTQYIICMGMHFEDVAFP